VFGGTLGAFMVTTPLPVVLRTMSGLKNFFFEQAISASASIESLIGYVAQARKSGIVSLETEAASISDRFLSKR
jgi:chemotaxis protein MotA